MRTVIAVLLVVISAGNSAYLGIPAVSSVTFAHVRTADWQWNRNTPTSEKLAVSGAALLWSSTVTSLAVLPWLKEPQRRKLCVPIACAYLGGAALYMAGMLVERYKR
jgi:hypothetical protein